MLQVVIAFHLIKGNGRHQGFDRKKLQKRKEKKNTLISGCWLNVSMVTITI
jgi:hypothetical protein